MKVWQALAILCAARDNPRMNHSYAFWKFEKKAKSILRQIGMKRREIESQYPDQCISELSLLCLDQKELAKEAKKSAAWMLQRN